MKQHGKTSGFSLTDLALLGIPTGFLAPKLCEFLVSTTNSKDQENELRNKMEKFMVHKGYMSARLQNVELPV